MGFVFDFFFYEYRQEMYNEERKNFEFYKEIDVLFFDIQLRSRF